MNRYRKIRNVLASLGLLAVVALAACTGATPVAASYDAPSSVQGTAPTATPLTLESETLPVGDEGDLTATPLPSALSAAAADVLSEAEIEGLLYMHEEEKLAHDVYLALYAEWGLNVFQNIANSEATHVSAVEDLLNRYAVTPVALPEAGAFADPALQALYDQLVETGTRSLEDALRVGAAIEEIDILDLAAHIAETDHADIQRVYENLTSGSENHLRAFVSNLESRTGETYVSQYLDPAAYNAIVGAEVARGNGRR